MEAPLHHSPVPLPAAPGTIMAPPRQHDAIGAAVLQQQVAAVMARKPAPGPTVITGREQCPRCASRDTKFCYYNNYNTAQPRHFCRSCRRYWTLGGSLRNVPVGGSTRKRPRPSRLSRAAASSAVTTTATSRGPLFTSCPAVNAPGHTATARSGGGLLSSLLPGSAAEPLLPVLEGRVGFNLGLEQPAGSTGAGDLLAQLGCGAVPLPWVPTTTVLEGDRAQTTWKSSGGAFPPASALWKELAAAMQPAGAGGLHHGATTPLLL